jgi:hypothetical protein
LLAAGSNDNYLDDFDFDLLCADYNIGFDKREDGDFDIPYYDADDVVEVGY